MGKINLDYMAGIFDGEGCIIIAKRKPISKTSEINPSYWIRIGVQITDRWICELFKFSFGGRIEISKKPTNKTFTCWRWVVDGQDASDILKILLPHLHLKRAQAELAIQFQNNKHHGGWGGQKPKEYTILEEANYVLMRNLKREKML